MASTELLGIYLNDHLAGATAGAELARRIADTHRDTVAGPALRRCADEIATDRFTLISLMTSLDVPVRRYKIGLGWMAEKLGRFKLNGRVTERSPSTSITELETLRLGVEGKACVWQVLRDLADHDARLDADQLDALIERARAQVDLLEDLRIRAAEKVFGGRHTARRRTGGEHVYDDVLRAGGDTAHASRR
jgi:hypothetical protein